MDSERADKILTVLEATEANLAKLERVWSAMREKIPSGIAFGDDGSYEDLQRQYADIVTAMPTIGKLSLVDSTMDLDTIAQSRFDAMEIDELEAKISVENAIVQPSRDIAEYRFRLRKRRQALVAEVVKDLVDTFDRELASLRSTRHPTAQDNASAPKDKVESLSVIVSRLDRVLGALSGRPKRWTDLRRHLAFGDWQDVEDIQALDWPVVRPGMLDGIYGENDPVIVGVASLDALEEIPAHTAVPTELSFGSIDAETFERLLFALVSAVAGYENPQWLMRTNAPDRGRDVSTERIIVDALGGTRRERVIIQCKHWLQRSIGITELSTLKEQMKLWEPPKVLAVVIATSGRFTADAVRAIELHNNDGLLPRIEMWPDSHLELLLARHPEIVAQFRLRKPAEPAE